MEDVTAFEFLKKELLLPKDIIVDDADGIKLGKNGLYLSWLIGILDKYAELKATNNGKQITTGKGCRS